MPQDGMQVTPVECKPCPPGTWNTCVLEPSCKWVIPQAVDSSLGTFIHILPGGPGKPCGTLREQPSQILTLRLTVGNCYPCASVSRCWTCNTHYGRITSGTYIDTTTPWKCPGGQFISIDIKQTSTNPPTVQEGPHHQKTAQTRILRQVRMVQHASANQACTRPDQSACRAKPATCAQTA
jgi:hypothetical protein